MYHRERLHNALAHHWQAIFDGIPRCLLKKFGQDLHGKLLQPNLIQLVILLLPVAVEGEVLVHQAAVAVAVDF
jgi:hypothetical protein